MYLRKQSHAKYNPTFTFIRMQRMYMAEGEEFEIFDNTNNSISYLYLQ